MLQRPVLSAFCFLCNLSLPSLAISQNLFTNDEISAYCSYIPENSGNSVGGVYRIELMTLKNISNLKLSYAFHQYGDMTNGYKTATLEKMKEDEVRRYVAHIDFPLQYEKMAQNVFAHFSYADTNVNIPCIETSNKIDPIATGELEPVVLYGRTSNMPVYNNVEHANPTIIPYKTGQSLDDLLTLIGALE